MKLNTQVYPIGLSIDEIEGSPIVIIPGLFGSISNWRSFAKAVAEDFPVIVVDQRNHGNSPHDESNTYFDTAGDLLELVESHNFEKVILCGHSMGGKTAMVFSLLYPDRVEKLVILDIAPAVYTHSHAPYLEALLDIDLHQLSSRSAADKELKSAIPEMSTRLFLLQNLVGSKGSYRWRINIEVLLKEMQTIVGFPLTEIAGRVNLSETLLMYGDNSEFVQAEHHGLTKTFFPNVRFEAISDAGHWLHVEQPQAVITSLISFLKRI